MYYKVSTTEFETTLTDCLRHENVYDYILLTQKCTQLSKKNIGTCPDMNLQPLVVENKYDVKNIIILWKERKERTNKFKVLLLQAWIRIYNYPGKS